MQTILNLIDGELVPPAAGRYLENLEPATGRAYSRVPASAADDVDRAVASAARAFPAWSEMPVEERSRLLLRVADRIETDLERFARAESIDTGKPLALARAVDVPRAVRNFRFFATAIVHFASESHATDRIALNYTLRRPRGVAGLISPWNLPLYLLSWKVAPALATGNTAVAKPSEITPMTAFLLSEVVGEEGIPPGVLNVVHGPGAPTGAALVEHDAVKTLSFTGGTATGRLIARSAAERFKKVALEMGGKNPTLVFADADIDDALDASVRAGFSNQGEICLCGSRILVEAAIHDRFVERLVERVSRLRVGDPLEDGTEQGALVSAAHLDKVASYVDLARREGGAILCGGERASVPNARCRDGLFYRPTVVAGLAPSCRVNQEEIFGPVVSVLRFRDENEAVAIANGTPYGLSASLWTTNLARAHRVAERLDCGTVWVNCWMLRDLRVPFGGTKESGVGREGGLEALRFFTEPKNVCVRVDGGGGR